jgi:hypothetical protein
MWWMPAWLERRLPRWHSERPEEEAAPRVLVHA